MGDKESIFTKESTYRNTRGPVELATTIPPESYRSQEFWTIEQERVFSKSWVCVGYTCQVDTPGKTITANVGGQPIVILRDKENKLKGFFNVCRHRGSLLVHEAGTYERLRCPYHSWTYDLSGNLLHCPLFISPQGGGQFEKTHYSLFPVRVESWGCFVFATLDPNAIPLLKFLGDLPERYNNFPLDELVLVRRKEYKIESNWKLVAENFLEYYHLPWVHPELCTVTAIDMHKRNQGLGMYMSFFASPLLQGGTPLDAGYLPAMPGLTPDEKNSGYFPMIFPNICMFLLPHHLFSLILSPVSPEKSEEYGDLLVHKSLIGAGVEPEFDEIMSFYDMVNRQDILAVERVQKGIQVRDYQGGRMSYRFEEPLHRFQNMVIDFMTGSPRIPVGDTEVTSTVHRNSSASSSLELSP